MLNVTASYAPIPHYILISRFVVADEKRVAALGGKGYADPRSVTRSFATGEAQVNFDTLAGTRTVNDVTAFIGNAHSLEVEQAGSLAISEN
jgi:hypothetical protein